MTRWFTIAVLCIAAVLPARAAELLMFEAKYCEWCERWDEEIGAVFHMTEEGKRAPLRRVDVHGAKPADAKLNATVNFTPTFVVVADGVEVGRIEGYPGEHFFWPMLSKLLERLPAPTAAALN